MTLADLLPSLPLSYAEGRTMALVFSADFMPALEAVQAEVHSKHQAVPVLLTDGRCLLCGDLLSEVGPGGLYAAGFSKLNPQALDHIHVIPWSEAVALLPVSAEDET